MKYIIIYLAIISIIAIILTGYDKYASKERPRSRVPEAVLITVSALGGSVAMYIAMLLIRHKTKHLKFMLGLPVIMLLQAVAGLFIYTKFF